MSIQMSEDVIAESDPYLMVVRYQERLYRGGWDRDELLSDLKAKLSSKLEPLVVLEAIAVLRILSQEDSSIAGRLLAIAVGEDDGLVDVWVEDGGIIILLEMLDVIVAFKRPEDIPQLTQMMVWDLFQIPSHILLLIRKYGCRELWDAIAAAYSMEGEYDEFIRAQHVETGKMISQLRSSDWMLPEDTRKELVALRASAAAATKPVLYVEGKTDRAILEVAYRRLFPSQERPFDIKECDVTGDAKGGAGGAGTLDRFIASVRPDSPSLALALFDRDKEGIDSYRDLPKYFVESPEGQLRSFKLAAGGRAAALILPTPEGRERYAELSNLPIEFMFGDDVLSMKTRAGNGLNLSFPELVISAKRHGKPVVGSMPNTMPETRVLDSGKGTFAMEIVSTLAAHHFEPFRELFRLIEDILSTHLAHTRT